MSTVVRMYDSEENARSALQLLAKEGYGSNEVFHFQPDAGDATEVVSRAVDSELIPGRYGKACVNALSAGHHVLAVLAPFGAAKMAEGIMDGFSPVNTDQLVEYESSASGPIFSELIGWPTLSRTRRRVPTGPVRSPRTLSGNLGLKLISKSATPLSSLVGMKPLTAPKSKTSSFGMPLLKRGPMFGFSAIKRESPERFDSFGIPLISQDPTPLSSMFGLKVLSHNDD